MFRSFKNFELIKLSIFLSSINVSLYSFKFFNHPFNTEFYHIFFINFFLALFSIFTFYYIYLKFFFFKKSFFFNILNFIFCFYVFFTFFKSIIFMFGSSSFAEFFSSIGFIFAYYEEGKLFLLLLIILIFIIFNLILKGNQNLIKFISYYGIIILLFQIFIVFSSDQLIHHSKVKNFSSKKISLEYPKKRVLLLVFDEYDFLTFEEQDNFSKKGINQLKESSVYFTNAFSPGRDTINSMPSIILGHDGSGNLKYNRSDFYFLINDKQVKKINYENSIFNLSNTSNTALLHSSLITYCHYLKKLTTCYDNTNNLLLRGSEKYYQGLNSVFSIIKNISNNIFENEKEKTDKIEIQKINKDLNYQINVRSFGNFVDHSLNIIQNNNHDVVLIHFPLPHYPAFYAKEKYNIDKETNLEQDYLINMRYADEIISNILNMIDKSPEDQKNLLIVTSDHGNRLYEKYYGEPRNIPFFLKKSDETRKIIVEKRSSNYHLKDVIKIFLKNDINHEEIAQFYENQIFKLPTMRNFEILDKLNKNKRYNLKLDFN